MRVIVYQASDTSALSKNFTRKDFKCPCGCTRQMVDSELVEKLQAIRDKLGKAIKVTSGYRCLSHNAAVGGSSGSKHRYGMAADWRLVDRSINPVALGIIATQYFKAVGIYWYDGCAIVHTDTRDAKATWLCDAPRHYPSTTYQKFILLRQWETSAWKLADNLFVQGSPSGPLQDLSLSRATSYRYVAR